MLQMYELSTAAPARERPARWVGRASPLFVLLVLVWPHQAQAEFAVCNQTLDVVNVAIGQENRTGSRNDAPEFVTEGWWTIGANQCANVIQEVLASRYIYVYATDIFGRRFLNGSTAMCVDSERFRIIGIDGCWQRGHIEASFFEVDTLDQERWTLFLSGSAP